jgi:hypothetical protein
MRYNLRDANCLHLALLEESESGTYRSFATPCFGLANYLSTNVNESQPGENFSRSTGASGGTKRFEAHFRVRPRRTDGAYFWTRCGETDVGVSGRPAPTANAAIASGPSAANTDHAASDGRIVAT